VRTPLFCSLRSRFTRRTHDSPTSKYVATSRDVRPRSHAASTSPRNSFEYSLVDTSLEMPTLPTLPEATPRRDAL
jgi:hypothetical protein